MTDDVDDLFPSLRGITPRPQTKTAHYLAEPEPGVHVYRLDPPLHVSATGRSHTHLRLRWVNREGWQHCVMDQHGTWLLLSTVPRVVEEVDHLPQAMGYRVQR